MPSIDRDSMVRRAYGKPKLMHIGDQKSPTEDYDM